MEIMTIKELSNYLSISDSEIRKMVRLNVIPFFRLGNRIKFKKSSINKWIDSLEKTETEYNLFYF